MDDIDRKLLNIIQTDFPIDSHPYDVLGERLGLAGEEVLSRVRELVDSGVIRKIGPSFDTRKLGHVSTLVAAKVPPGRLEEVAEIVSSFAEVTHNYGRDFEYNLWFTLVSKDGESMDATIAAIKAAAGVDDVQVLPSEKTFKIKVDFEF